MDWADAPARALVVRRPRPQRVKGTPKALQPVHGNPNSMPYPAAAAKSPR
ncbi:hypothetical protein MA5S0921_4178 [Mycobacteroides abscessus 5S-0921]|uniref:Uncharacterized protein n=1 Tax=Mycobacteroides abscessus subsp. bolletii 1513 TaxID=1299321 RepID=X8DH68_9MYCO|nr:hypothetical protein MA5S0421_3479 [Mycobacteroides abscessus 5S-0421]EIU08613.1 hypothetical protein MA5S0304_3224 [Mycobacteroides abscessus 5S-0304]EIU22663.1 hypothetical protein MA5S0708_3150 [Mycobacteroides abscessus 5S-0708]EIU24733.1 hypothetical protein MA5S0817_2771 [Mycobacteroides abscessus 5S-0817]EIU29384.1 hypothetical protein MA5S1212_2906 [Mycobacteroides abscessus 5S-1212]EIU43734.1 hypothetical protein MA5S1215_3256 [Mycobacteroides abscessus 5S-1215]EIU88017.1 hypothet